MNTNRIVSSTEHSMAKLKIFFDKLNKENSDTLDSIQYFE